MIRVHHLNNSRSHRILWLLEELAVDYDVIPYQRDSATNLAPPELKRVHPLGKSPVIEDDGRVVAESGAIVQYLVERYGNGRLMPPRDSDAYVDYLHWLHFAEGSAMLPILLRLYTGRLGEAAAPLKPRIDEQLAAHFDYMEAALATRPFFVGEEMTAADVQMSFVVEIGKMYGELGTRPNLAGFLERIGQRPAYRRALERGGPYAYAA